MHERLKKVENNEILNPERIFLVSPVFQPRWYAGEVDMSHPETLSDKIRGDLIIENLRNANDLGYSVILIHDPKDNKDFIGELNKVSSAKGLNKIIIQEQVETTYSGARRDAIRAATMDGNGCEVVVMLELEKPMIEHVSDMVRPIVEGRADVIITDRGIVTDGELSNEPEKPNENLRGLPRYQARSEAKFNKWANRHLKDLGWMPEDFPDIDWMGNRAWRNSPELNSLFLARFKAEVEQPNLKPDHLSSSLFYPIATIFWENKSIREEYRIKKLELVPVLLESYRHPKNQSELENNDPSFITKRDKQRAMLTAEMVEFTKLLSHQESLVYVQ